jgi:hypothetical protein
MNIMKTSRLGALLSATALAGFLGASLVPVAAQAAWHGGGAIAGHGGFGGWHGGGWHGGYGGWHGGYGWRGGYGGWHGGWGWGPGVVGGALLGLGVGAAVAGAYAPPAYYPGYYPPPAYYAAPAYPGYYPGY